MVVVEAEGLIADVRDVSDEVPAKEEVEATEDLVEETEDVRRFRKNGRRRIQMARCCRLGVLMEKKNTEPGRCNCKS